MRKINKIVIHRTQSDYGNKDFIRRIHVDQNGWSDIGYHYLIYSPYPTWDSFEHHKPDFNSDGKVVACRPVAEAGAHTIDFDQDMRVITNHNADSIGIALVGMDHFTGKQLESLRTEVRRIRKQYGPIPVFGHDELLTVNPKGKVCPNIEMEHLRAFLNEPVRKPFIGPTRGKLLRTEVH